MTEDVLVSVDRNVGRIRLNRPKAIHALTREMCDAMSETLLAWRDDPSVQVVVIDHAEGRGFCAGGDVVMLARSGASDAEDAKKFFFSEYRLNHLLFTYPKPTVAIMDGITMGGGVGISLPCEYRIATEATRLAMPETSIGLVPDIGGGWYLSRLPGRAGQFMALTGARLDASECVYLGLATNYIEQSSLEELHDRILKAPGRLKGTLGSMATTPPDAKIEANMASITRLFASDRLEEVLAALEPGRERMGAFGTGYYPDEEPLVLQGIASAARGRSQPRHLRRRDARRICARRTGRTNPRLSRRRPRVADRQGQQPAVGPADAGSS